jgi:hypothetical protein
MYFLYPGSVGPEPQRYLLVWMMTVCEENEHVIPGIRTRTYKALKNITPVTLFRKL